MKKRNILAYILGAGMLFSSCSLDEYNPSGVTVDKMAEYKDGYIKLLNSCYFDLSRYFYGRNLLLVTEAGTDIWTADLNSNNNQNYFKYASGGAMPIDMAKDFWIGAYDAINYCNIIINRADVVKGFASEDEKKTRVAEAHFLRALYYFHLVEQFGDCPLALSETKAADLNSVKTTALEIYKKAILPDLRIAVQNLPVTPVEVGRPSKKAALGLLAKAALQTKEYNTQEFLEEALSTAKNLIDNAGAYQTGLYGSFVDNFNAANNKSNKEALYQLTYSPNYGSTNVYDHNKDFKRFYSTPTYFGAISNADADKAKVGGWSGGDFMPSKYLLDVFKNADGSLDPRYALSFQTEWKATATNYAWNQDAITQFDRAANITVGTVIPTGANGIRFARSGEADYATTNPNKLAQNYLWVDMNDLYGADNRVKMKYTRVNRNPGEVENPFLRFYPSLTKFNSGSLTMYNNRVDRITSDAYSTVMRLGEVYLIAAEAEFYLRGANTVAAGYVNALRTRVAAQQISVGDINLQFLLDERARELCGEYGRWYDLKRTGKLTKAYLTEKNPDVGQYFVDGTHGVRPIPQVQMDAISNPNGYQNNGYN
ncbi:RagB/SusD domain protein [Pseudopedobacter saltans DSM 12145]|uniref:RagB/SusD domain protein n=1 Tax=Pseudopedobacter saltans (strain ATCC 51119 / DSM 12145 / JCM 21818 / CCUG 39354 / LMG 10337 / NBRC 100064 / NCIMB 13643) TaxID=762903 RepID=F0S4D0_PSESL|nr:RagB/SusD family nutrient uptake outer membrane protein [Pseudopedobacter saltans]ADY50887.1 RagB/SusD domain protein [Pseudopedobacter saltans DSM 12145]